jgi:CBS domain-containing protein
MKGMPPEMENFWEHTDFRIAKSNFIKAARNGLQTVLHWRGKNYAAKALILDHLLPLAEKGLQHVGVADDDIRRYLGVIERRVQSEQTGAQWQQESFRRLRKQLKPSVASRLLVQQMLTYQKEDLPVHEWQLMRMSHIFPRHLQACEGNTLVEDLMHQDVISVRENVCLEVVEKILQWRKINHLPIESHDGVLIGMVSSSLLAHKDYSPDQAVREVMIREVITVTPGMRVEEAAHILHTHQIGCLPVLENGALVGILTRSDFKE